jgi:hypothetical protein
MAKNFHMFTHKTTDALHIKLTGDLDGSSAFELVNFLASNHNRYYQIFINTKDLKSIYPFGVDVLQHNLPGIEEQGAGMIFIGKNIAQPLN